MISEMGVGGEDWGRVSQKGRREWKVAVPDTEVENHSS